MPTPTCTFDLENTCLLEMQLYLEPEGQGFPVPSGKRVQVRFFGQDRPVAMRCSVDAEGRQEIAFWPQNGSYEIFLEGRDVWDLALERQSAEK